MKQPRVPVSAVLLVAALAGGCALWPDRQDNAHIAPPQDVAMDGEVLAKFQHEIEEYVELHRELLHRIPNVTPHATADEIAAHRAKMTKGIQEARRREKRGEIFKPKVDAAFRRILERETSGPDGKAIIVALQQGNPKIEGTPQHLNPTVDRKEGAVNLSVNAAYADDAPVSSVPPSLLLKLPALPEQVKYAFVGRALILRDTEANVILDFIPDAIADRSIPR